MWNRNKVKGHNHERPSGNSFPSQPSLGRCLRNITPRSLQKREVQGTRLNISLLLSPVISVRVTRCIFPSSQLGKALPWKWNSGPGERERSWRNEQLCIWETPGTAGQAQQGTTMSVGSYKPCKNGSGNTGWTCVQRGVKDLCTSPELTSTMATVGLLHLLPYFYSQGVTVNTQRQTRNPGGDWLRPEGGEDCQVGRKCGN